MGARRQKNSASPTSPAREGAMCAFTFKAKLLSSLSNEVRLAALTIISEQETPVGELAVKLGRSQSSLSQHLAKLRAARLVDTRRDGPTIFYSCNNGGVHRLLRDIREIFS